MSTAEATRVTARHDETGSFRAVGAAVAWAGPGAGEPPPIALVKEHLNSTVVAGALLLTAALHGQRIDGPYLALAGCAYAVSLKVMTQPRLERVGSGAEWGRIFRHRTIEWACVAGILLLAGYCFRATRLFPGPRAGNLAGRDAVRARRRAGRGAGPHRARVRAQRRPAPAGHRGRKPGRRRTRHEDRRRALARHGGRFLRRPAAGAPAVGDAAAVARQVRGPAGVRQAAWRARHLRLPADLGPPEDPGACSTCSATPRPRSTSCPTCRHST